MRASSKPKEDSSGGLRVNTVAHATQAGDEVQNVEYRTPPARSCHPAWEGVTLQDAPFDSDLDSSEDEDLVAALASVQRSPNPSIVPMYEESDPILAPGSALGSGLCITNLDESDIGSEDELEFTAARSASIVAVQTVPFSVGVSAAAHPANREQEPLRAVKSGVVPGGGLAADFIIDYDDLEPRSHSDKPTPKVIIHLDPHEPTSVQHYEQESHSSHMLSQSASPSILHQSSRPQQHTGLYMPPIPSLSPRQHQQYLVSSNTSTKPPIVPVSPSHHYSPESLSPSPRPLEVPSEIHLSPHSAGDDSDDTRSIASSSSAASTTSKRHRFSSAFRRMRASSDASSTSSIFKHGRHRSASESSSVHVPKDLPALPDEATVPGLDRSDTVIRRAEEAWENRAVALATNTLAVDGDTVQRMGRLRVADSHRARQRSPSIGTPKTELDIQTAIDLHEKGDLVESTQIFGRLADPQGDNNPLAQVLYGLALRHGWGIQAKPDEAIAYLRMAASNSALIEDEAKKANIKITPRNRKTGAGGAKGELTLAIFELANCFRFGWGVEKDAVAAKHYYETAANLGDPDAMSEVGWCLLEGFGCKKDKFMAAQFYRMAEKAGKEEVGQSWIWKEKYDPTSENMEKHKTQSIKKHRLRKGSNV